VPTPDQGDTLTFGYIPDCNDPGALDAGDRAWCNGKDPNAGVNGRKTRISAALDSMALLGPPCDRIASVVRDVLAAGHIRVFHIDTSDPTAYKKGGFARIGEGSGGYILLQDTWTDSFYDRKRSGTAYTYVNNVRTTYYVDLQYALAHEGDHLLRNFHIDDKTPSNPNGIGGLTVNSEHCGGF